MIPDPVPEDVLFFQRLHVDVEEEGERVEPFGIPQRITLGHDLSYPFTTDWNYPRKKEHNHVITPT